MRRYFILTTKKCRIYAAFGVSQTPKKVYRPKGADCSDFIVIFTSETAKKYKYESGDKIAVQITPVAESADEILEYDYKATVIQKAFAFKTISFERAAK